MALNSPTGIRLRFPPGRPSSLAQCQSGARRQGYASPRQIRRALASSAPFRPATFATGGSGGNISRAVSVQGTGGLATAKQKRRLHKILDTAHRDHALSFLVDPNKNLFYCYGCGCGGDVIRFAELYHQVHFPQALTLLWEWRGLAPLLNAVIDLYCIQLHRHSEPVAYLEQRGIHSSEVIEHMRIGYAPSGCLRSWLTQLGYPLSILQQAGLVTAAGHDSYILRIIFPLESNLYGRSIRSSAPPHRFLPGSKGGLYLWETVRQYPEVILVEGLFDYAVLWQAGLRNVTCSLGNHLNARQFEQLCASPRTVFLAFDADTNGSGQKASQWLANRLNERGVTARRIVLPDGHDPNSFFVQGGDARQFQALLETAQP